MQHAAQAALLPPPAARWPVDQGRQLPHSHTGLSTAQPRVATLPDTLLSCEHQRESVCEPRRGAAPATAYGAQGRRRILCGWGQRGLHSRRSARLALRGRGQRRARDPTGPARGSGTGPLRVGAGRSGLSEPAGEPAKRGSFRGEYENRKSPSSSRRDPRECSSVLPICLPCSRALPAGAGHTDGLASPGVLGHCSFDLACFNLLSSCGDVCICYFFKQPVRATS